MRRYWAVLLVWALAVGTAKAATAPPPEVASVPVSLLVDLSSGQTLYAREPNRRFLPASVTKVMTAYVAFEAMAQRRLAADRKFTVPDATARMWQGRGSSLYLKSGAVIDADMLVRAITTVSANDAAVVLAQGYAGDVARWCALMNAEAGRLGMVDSHFATPNGWPDGGATYVSAQDLVRLADALITRHPALYRRYFGQSRLTWDGVTQENHDPVSGVVQGADGIKTGHTNEAGYNFLGSAERNGRRLVMVVAGVRSGAEMRSAARALLDWGFAQWRVRPLFAAGTPLASAQVQGGDARSVPLIANRAVQATLPLRSAAPIALTVRYRGPLVAPIAKGAQVAELEVAVAGQPPARVPLFAGAAVAPAGPIDRVINGLAALFA